MIAFGSSIKKAPLPGGFSFFRYSTLELKRLARELGLREQQHVVAAAGLGVRPRHVEAAEGMDADEGRGFQRSKANTLYYLREPRRCRLASRTNERLKMKITMQKTAPPAIQGKPDLKDSLMPSDNIVAFSAALAPPNAQ